MGPADAERTVVLVAHHDAAHSGLIYHPAIPELVFGRAPWLLERSDTSPPLMAPAVAIPALIGAGALSGNRALVKTGMALGAVSAALLADIGSRETVTGANDNATGVALLVAMARALAERPDGERSRDARLDLGGGAVRGNAGLRPAALRRAPAREHVLPLRGHRSARRTCWCCAARG